MTIHNHIGDELLMSYAAGSLAEGWSLLVASHLALCPDCRRRSGLADAVGGSMLESLEEAAVAVGAFDSIMSRIESRQSLPKHTVKTPIASGSIVLPEPLRSYVGGDVDTLKWRRLGVRAYHVPVSIHDNETQARLLRIAAEMPMPIHGHHGRELTLVLGGSLCEGSAVFTRGDVVAADESVEHQPISGPNEDCICLAVTDAKLRFKSLIARLAQPFLRI